METTKPENTFNDVPLLAYNIYRIDSCLAHCVAIAEVYHKEQNKYWKRRQLLIWLLCRASGHSWLQIAILNIYLAWGWYLYLMIRTQPHFSFHTTLSWEFFQTRLSNIIEKYKEMFQHCGDSLGRILPCICLPSVSCWYTSDLLQLQMHVPLETTNYGPKTSGTGRLSHGSHPGP